MPATHKPQRKFCTTREAAEILGVSLKTAQLWTEKGLLEAWRTEGGHRRIYRDSVERLLFEAQADAGGEAKEEFHVVVADDEYSMRSLYALRMAAWKMKPRVSLAASGTEALLMVGRHVPDLFICELNMPDVDGLRMVQTLRRLPEFAPMVIVVATGLDTRDIHARGGLPGDVRLFPKPISFDELERMAEAVAAVHGSARKPAQP